MPLSLGRYSPRQIDRDSWAIEEKTPFTQGLCYLLLGRERALLVDTGLGFAGLPAAVAGLTDLPVTVACTHAHVDHIGGNHFFGDIWYHEADREVFALHVDPEYTRTLADPMLPAPLRPLARGLLRRVLTVDTSGRYHTFRDGHLFDLGGRVIEVVHTPGHTPGSVCFWDRAARMLFSGDTLCEWGVLLDLAGSCPVEVFCRSVGRLAAMADGFDTLWPGHHGFPVDKGYIEEYARCARQVLEGTATPEEDRGRPCARCGRVLITLQKNADREAQ